MDHDYQLLLLNWEFEFKQIMSSIVYFSIVARFDFSWGDAEFHQESLDNLRVAIKSTKKLCAVSFL